MTTTVEFGYFHEPHVDTNVDKKRWFISPSMTIELFTAKHGCVDDSLDMTINFFRISTLALDALVIALVIIKKQLNQKKTQGG